MAETNTPKITMNNTTTQPQKNMYVQIMERRLDGVMFHTFYSDLFELLGLTGFKKFHAKQAMEEKRSLEKLKSCYMKKYKMLPILETKSVEEYWSKYANLDMQHLTQPQIAEIVKASLDHYLSWEKTSLKNFIAWDEMEVAKEIMKEIDMIDYIVYLLNKYGYDYENILYLSEKL